MVKLIPAEVIALYLTLKESTITWTGGWAAVCLLLVIVVRTHGTHKAGKPLQLSAVIISSISFILWIYATGGQILGVMPPANYPGLISASIGVWTFLIPYVYKGD